MMVPEFCWWIFKGPIRRGKEALAHFAIATPQQGQNIFRVEFEITYRDIVKSQVLTRIYTMEINLFPMLFIPLHSTIDTSSIHTRQIIAEKKIYRF